MDPNPADAAAAERTLISPPDPHPIAPRDKILPLGKPSLSIYIYIYMTPARDPKQFLILFLIASLHALLSGQGTWLRNLLG